MELIRKKNVNGSKVLCIAGVDIPYRIETDGDKKRFIAGPLAIPYYRDPETESVYLRLAGCRVYLKQNRKARHYRMRDTLTLEKCRKILEKELRPLLGYKPDLRNPRSFNEKINWFKLNYHNPLITECCDKYAVKGYVARTVGAEYTLPVLGVWKDPAAIDFDALPQSFVLKVNWSSGFNIIVRDKALLDRQETLRKLERWIQPASNSYYDTFNWGYKAMQPVIFAEPYIEQKDGQLHDYKFFMCSGRCEYMFIAADRYNGTGMTQDFFTRDFEHLPFDYSRSRHADPLPEKPKNYEKMIALAEKLSAPFPFVRVDFYEVDDRVLLGEMTFYPGGGTLRFSPVEWDFKLGEKIALVQEMRSSQ